MKTEKSTKASITLKLDKKLLQEARRLAAEAGTTINALLAAQLEEVVRKKNYEQTKRNALAFLARA
jgi:antitoxin component of RelBE/YafQ-DinJ toxin-antitoxin module